MNLQAITDEAAKLYEKDWLEGTGLFEDIGDSAKQSLTNHGEEPSNGNVFKVVMNFPEENWTTLTSEEKQRVSSMMLKTHKLEKDK